MTKVALIMSDEYEAIDDPITTITEDEVDYLLQLVHKETDDKGIWGSDEESALETLETIKQYFQDSKKKKEKESLVI